MKSKQVLVATVKETNQRNLELLYLVIFFSGLLYTTLTHALPGEQYSDNERVQSSSCETHSLRTTDNINKMNHEICQSFQSENIESSTYCGCRFPDKSNGPFNYSFNNKDNNNLNSFVETIVNDVTEDEILQKWIQDYLNFQSYQNWNPELFKTIVKNNSDEDLKKCFGLEDELKEKKENPSICLAQNSDDKDASDLKIKNSKFLKLYSGSELLLNKKVESKKEEVEQPLLPSDFTKKAAPMLHETLIADFFNELNNKESDEEKLKKIIESDRILNGLDIHILTDKQYKGKDQLTAWREYLSEKQINNKITITDHIEKNFAAILTTHCKKILRNKELICSTLNQKYLTSPELLKKIRERYLVKNNIPRDPNNSDYAKVMRNFDQYYCESVNQKNTSPNKEKALERLFEKLNKANIKTDKEALTKYFNLDNQAVAREMNKSINRDGTINSDRLKESISNMQRAAQPGATTTTPPQSAPQAAPATANSKQSATASAHSAASSPSSSNSHLGANDNNYNNFSNRPPQGTQRPQSVAPSTNSKTTSSNHHNENTKPSSHHSTSSSSDTNSAPTAQSTNQLPQNGKSNKAATTAANTSGATAPTSPQSSSSNSINNRLPASGSQSAGGVSSSQVGNNSGISGSFSPSIASTGSNSSDLNTDILGAKDNKGKVAPLIQTIPYDTIKSCSLKYECLVKALNQPDKSTFTFKVEREVDGKKVIDTYTCIKGKPECSLQPIENNNKPGKTVEDKSTNKQKVPVKKDSDYDKLRKALQKALN